MYSDHLEVRQVPITDIYLDPNNPRFWTERGGKEVADKKIMDPKVQANALEAMKKYGVEELYNSILRNGFLPLDRIVVRPIEDSEGKYVVVEGNRRFSALQRLRSDIDNHLISEEGIDDEYLQRLREATDTLEVLVYQGSDEHDVSWMLQGIRHIGGIRDWEPAQRARLVADQIDENGLNFRTAGQRFGLTAQAVGRLYRAYKALEQMREDEDFGAKARNDYFSLFEEAYRSSTVREWLGWDEQSRRFTNDDNAKRFYSWISPDDEDAEARRRIHDPKQIKELSLLLSDEHKGLLEQFDRHELSIGEAAGRAVVKKPTDWRAGIASALTIISDLPQSAMFDDTADFLTELQALAAEIAKREAACKQVLDAGNS